MVAAVHSIPVEAVTVGKVAQGHPIWVASHTTRHRTQDFPAAAEVTGSVVYSDLAVARFGSAHQVQCLSRVQSRPMATTGLVAPQVVRAVAFTLIPM